MQEIAVLDLARLFWRKRRLHAAAQLRYRRDPQAGALKEAAEKNGWQGVVEHTATMVDKGNSARSSILEAARSHGETFRAVAGRLVNALRNGVDATPNAAQIQELKRSGDQLEAMRVKLGPMLEIIEHDDLDEMVSARA